MRCFCIGGQEAWVDLRSVVAWRSVLSGGIFVLYRGKRPLNTWLSLPLSTPFSATVPGSSLGAFASSIYAESLLFWEENLKCPFIKQLGKYIVHRRSITAGVNACCKRRPVERRCSFFYWENLMDIKPDFTTCTFNATFGNPIPLPHTLGFLPFLRRSNTVNSAFVP